MTWDAKETADTHSVEEALEEAGGRIGQAPESKRPDESMTRRASLGRGYRLVLNGKCRLGFIGGEVFLAAAKFFSELWAKYLKTMGFIFQKGIPWRAPCC